MNRETTTIHLPVSRMDAQVVTYFTLEEDDTVNKYGLEGAEAVIVVDEATGNENLNVKNIPVDRNRREIRKMAELGVVSATKDGETVPVGAAFVANLPRQDVEVLTEKLLKVRSGVSDDPKEAPKGTEKQ